MKKTKIKIMRISSSRNSRPIKMFNIFDPSSDGCGVGVGATARVNAACWHKNGFSLK